MLPGNYNVRILHFRSGDLISETQSVIVVRKSGLSADIFEFAHKHSPLYGIFAIMFPEDGHGPQHKVRVKEVIKKITIKVSV